MAHEEQGDQAGAGGSLSDKGAGDSLHGKGAGDNLHGKGAGDNLQRIVSGAVLREAEARLGRGEGLVNGAWVHGNDVARLRRRAARGWFGQRFELLLFWGFVALFGLALVGLVQLIL